MVSARSPDQRRPESTGGPEPAQRSGQPSAAIHGHAASRAGPEYVLYSAAFEICPQMPATLPRGPNYVLMTDSTLTNRLKQHSRRAGLMVGLTMALTVAICIGGFVTIYARLDPLTSDVIPASERNDDDEEVAVAPDATQPPAGPTPAPAAPGPTTAPPPPGPTAAAGAQPTTTAFTPTHQSSSNQTINLRAEPSRADGVAIIRPLSIATPLQFLNEEAPTANPAEDGDVWMKFRTENNEIGWIREIDSEPYQESP